MQISLKKAITAGLLVSSALGALSAHASAIQPSSGDGSLMFFLTDTVTHQTYTAVLSEDVNSYFSAGQATTPPPVGGVVNIVNGDANFSLNLTSDSAYNSFVSGAGSHTLNWGIIGGAYTGASALSHRPTGIERIITTTSTPANILGVPEAGFTGGVATNINQDVTTLNDSLHLNGANSGVNGVFGTADSANNANFDLYGTLVSQGGLVPGGSAITLYGLSGNGGGTGNALAYNLGTASFSGGTLSFTGNGNTVPLPAAVWLFGSGLVGLAGISRRRRSAQSA